METVYN